MRAQVLSAWIAMLRGHAELTRAMNARLLAEHGLTVNDFDVLVQLADAPGHALRRVDLADRVVLTPSGITRLLEGLERSGFVCKRRCDSDARVTYAQLTDSGLRKLKEASATHLADVDDMFGGHFSADELDTLAELLGRLAATDRCPGAGAGIGLGAVAASD